MSAVQSCLHIQWKICLVLDLGLDCKVIRGKKGSGTSVHLVKIKV